MGFRELEFELERDDTHVFVEKEKPVLLPREQPITKMVTER